MKMTMVNLLNTDHEVNPTGGGLSGALRGTAVID